MTRMNNVLYFFDQERKKEKIEYRQTEALITSVSVNYIKMKKRQQRYTCMC